MDTGDIEKRDGGTTSMSTLAHYHPREIDIDLADLPRWLYSEIASLHGQIAAPPAPPVLTCLGNNEPMYVWRNNYGRYFARHYPGGNSDNHSHTIATMSDEHRRQAEYGRRAASDRGLDARLEVSTGNGTRLDLGVFGKANSGFEIQRSSLSRAKAKSRAFKSFNAGWQTAWITDQEDLPNWVDHVPTARLTVRGWDQIPPPNTVDVVIRDFSRERDKNSRCGWRYVHMPRAVLLDEVVCLMPAGEIVPVSVGKSGAVMLAFKGAAEIIDSCTYAGASMWRPTSSTPRRQETAQDITRPCNHHAAVTVIDHPRFPTCQKCGSRVQHYSVTICFHCKLAEQQKAK